jgi:hypothetical protein
VGTRPWDFEFEEVAVWLIAEKFNESFADEAFGYFFFGGSVYAVGSYLS